MLVNTALIICIASQGLPGRYEIGYAAHYREQLMHQVCTNRGLSCRPCAVALPDGAPLLGHDVLVWSLTTGQKRLCTVADYAHPNHRDSIVRRGIVAEFDLESAKAMCRGVTHYGAEPPRACPVIVQYL